MDESPNSIPGPATCAALVAAQAAINPVEKGSTNTFHKYRYASGDEIIAEARSALNSAGLATFATRWQLTETPYQWTDEKGAVIDDVALRLLVRYRLVHTSGEVMDFEPFSVPVLPEKGRPIDKAEAGARTYALSYFLRDLLLIPRVDESADVDQRDDSRHAPKPRAQAAPARQDPQRRETPAPAQVTPAQAGEIVRGKHPHLAGEIAALVARGDLSDAAKLDELRKLRDGARPADAALVAEARKLLAAAQHADAGEKARVNGLLSEYTRGSCRLEDIGPGDMGGFVAEVQAVINGRAAA